MTAKRRGKRGEVHIYRPGRSTTWWARYTANGKRYARNTGKTNEGEARIFAANIARMVGAGQFRRARRKAPAFGNHPRTGEGDPGTRI